MKILIQLLFVFAISILYSFQGLNVDENKQDWIQIFNGNDLEGWKVKINGFPLGEDKLNTFKVKDNSLVVSYENYDHFKDYFGHIFYKNPYSNYRLRLDYRFVGNQCKGGEGWATKNSGVITPLFLVAHPSPPLH